MDTPNLFDLIPYTQQNPTQIDWAIDTIGEDPSWSEINDGATVKARLYGDRAFKVKSISRDIGWATVAEIGGNFQTFLPLSDLSLLSGCNCFETIPWNERSEWQDEPLDPDDVWNVGDRVQWKEGLQQKGTVQGLERRQFLGGYLNYIVCRWDDSASDVMISPEQLWRIRNDSVTPPHLPVTESKYEDVGGDGAISPTNNDSVTPVGCVSISKSAGTARGDRAYFRYSWRESKKVHHVHIPGGNIDSPTARSHRDEVESAIASGKSPGEVLDLISSWSRYKK